MAGAATRGGGPSTCCATSTRTAPAPASQGADAAGALVQRSFDIWNTGQGTVADAVLGATYLDHAHPETIGPAAVRSRAPRFHAADPEVRMNIEIVAADADFVAVRNTISRCRNGLPTESNGIAAWLAFRA